MTEHVNHVRFGGTVAQAPRVRETKAGGKITTFVIGSLHSFTDGEGHHREHEEFLNVVAWDALAEKATQLTIGDSVLVVGRLKTRTWSDDKGFKHRRTEIHADQIN
jgi:single-strand DNA-binding protein